MFCFICFDYKPNWINRRKLMDGYRFPSVRPYAIQLFCITIMPCDCI